MIKPQTIPDKNQHRIAVDTVKNPAKGFLGGMTADEAKKILKSKFKYTDEEISRLEESKLTIRQEKLIESYIRTKVRSMLKENPDDVPDMERLNKSIYKLERELSSFVGKTKPGSESSNLLIQLIVDLRKTMKNIENFVKENDKTDGINPYNR